MKLAVIGGGGVRSPFLARTLVANAKQADINEIVFMDINEEKLEVFGNLSKHIASRIDSTIDFKTTTDPTVAIKDANYIITTIRVGDDIGRTRDEEIAQKYGLLGQETTGVGGFSFSLRSIPVLCEYLDLAKEIADPGCIAFNFTNPAGLVTECLKKLGYENVYGICDGPMSFQRELASRFESPDKFEATWYGLNHLSFLKDAKYDGQDVQAKLVSDEHIYANTDMKIMGRELVDILNGEFPNEYLYFFYYNNKVLESIANANSTRGRAVMEYNSTMLEEMKKADSSDFEKQFEIFYKALMMRESTYFTIESGIERNEEKPIISLDEFISQEDQGGYAGVALNFIKGFMGIKDVTMTLLVQNHGSIDFLGDEQVIEISCDISKGEVTRHKVKDVPVVQKQIITQIKAFEHLATEAIIHKSKKYAIQALMVHPLINTYDLATKLVTEIMETYPEYTAGWE